MLLMPSQTPYDLTFTLFRTPVRVHVSFWIVAALLGWPELERNGIGFLMLWVVCVLVSILLHEFGHVWAGKLFGSDGEILLYSFGGLAIGASEVRARWQRIVVSLAGPAIQLALFGVMYAYLRYGRMDAILDSRVAATAYTMMMEINLFWPLFNLLPVWPLDGGKVTAEIAQGVSPRSGFRVSLMVSIGAAAFIAVNTILKMNGRPHVPYLAFGGLYTVIVFALLAFESYTLLQQQPRGPWSDERSPWDR
jgi:Zn-dependent protease